MGAATLALVPKSAPKAVRSEMDTIVLTVDVVNQWRIPPFQRPLRTNAKVHEIARKLGEDGGCIQGVITLGRILPDKTLYVVDGQHRLEAFRLSGLKQGYADRRLCDFDSMQAMAIEFGELNAPIARMTPDDSLRALEFSVPALEEIRKACPFIGYGKVKRADSPGGPIVGMALVLRAWWTSGKETPAASVSGTTPAAIAAEMSKVELAQLIAFLEIAAASWGRDPEYWRLWSGLNLTIAMWLYRRLVIDQTRGLKRAIVLGPKQFAGCLTALSADAKYVDWLVGRAMGDNDRSPCYTRMTQIFARYLVGTGVPAKQAKMPGPAWAAHSGRPR